MKKGSFLIFVISLLLLSFTWVTCSSDDPLNKPKRENNKSKSETEVLVESALLSEAKAEELGINSKILSQIDNIAKFGIEQNAYPGCQILVAVDGKNIYRKC